MAEEAMGRLGVLSPEARAELRAHVAVCAGCAAVSRRYQSVVATVSGAPQAEIPPEVLQKTHESVMTAVRARQGRTLSVGWWCGLAAAVVVGAGLGWLLTRTTEQPLPVPAVAKAQVPESPSNLPPTVVALPAASVVSSASALSSAFDAAVGAKEALALLEGTLHGQGRARGEKELQEVLGLCDRLIARWPGGEAAVRARRLQSTCYVELGESAKAHTTFLVYADERGELAQRAMVRHGVSEKAAAGTKESVAARTIVAEAETLMSRKESARALQYCDDLVSRYPGSEPAAHALYSMGLYCRQSRQPYEAMRLWRQVIETTPSSAIAQRARAMLPGLLYNVGKTEEAASAWQEYGRYAADEQDRAMACWNAADMLASRGSKFEPAARELMTQLVRDYPQSTYAQRCRDRLEQKGGVAPTPDPKDRPPVRTKINPLDVIKM
jgi:tetratricopeptide (TPR) repeat protein